MILKYLFAGSNASGSSAKRYAKLSRYIEYFPWWNATEKSKRSY
jgi:hypothetical protein